MKIAIVGTGMVGGALARAWNADHQVTLITRDPAKPEVRALVDELDGVQAAEVSPAAASGADVVVLAVPAAAAVEVIAALGDLSGTVVIDPGNPLAPDFSGLTVGTTTSLAEKVAEATDGRVVKAFNIIGAHRFATPEHGGEAATMPVAGDDAEAKALVMELAEALGFEAVDVGPLTESRSLEPLALLWIRLSYVQQAGSVAWRLIRD